MYMKPEHFNLRLPLYGQHVAYVTQHRSGYYSLTSPAALPASLPASVPDKELACM